MRASRGEASLQTLKETAPALSQHQVTNQNKLSHRSSNLYRNECSPKARTGPKTKMWYFRRFKYTDYAQIIFFIFESCISKHCFQEGLQVHSDDGNEDGALLRQRATKFCVCLNTKLSKQNEIPKKNISNNLLRKLTRNSDGILVGCSAHTLPPSAKRRCFCKVRLSAVCAYPGFGVIIKQRTFSYLGT